MAKTKPNRYWMNFDNIASEMYKVMEEQGFDRMPFLKMIYDINSSLASSIRKYHPGFRKMMMSLAANKTGQEKFEDRMQICDLSGVLDYNAPEREAAAKDSLDSILSVLDENAREVVSMKLKGFTFAEIGKRYDLTKSRIEQIYSSSIEKIRENTRCQREYSNFK